MGSMKTQGIDRGKKKEVKREENLIRGGRVKIKVNIISTSLGPVMMNTHS